MMFRFVLTLAALLALIGSAGARHGCTTWTTSEPELTTEGTGVDDATYYVFNDETWCCLFSLWVYQESNGIAGAQRGDEVHDDTCHGLIRPDTLVF